MSYNEYIRQTQTNQENANDKSQANQTNKNDKSQTNQIYVNNNNIVFQIIKGNLGKTPISEEKFNSDDINKAIDNITEEITKALSNNLLKERLEILYDCEKKYLELTKNYKEEIKFTATLQEDIRKERSKFFSISLIEVHKTLEGVKLDKKVTDLWISELVNNYTKSLDISSELAKDHVLNTMGMLRNLSRENINKISENDYIKQSQTNQTNVNDNSIVFQIVKENLEKILIDEKFSSDDINKTISNITKEITKALSNNLLEERLAISSDYEKKYLELTKDYKEEIKFVATLQEDIRRERSKFFSEMLQEVHKAFENIKMDKKVTDLWISDLVNSYTKSLDISSDLAKDYVLNTMDMLHNLSRENINKISEKEVK